MKLLLLFDIILLTYCQQRWGGDFNTRQEYMKFKEQSKAETRQLLLQNEFSTENQKLIVESYKRGDVIENGECVNGRSMGDYACENVHLQGIMFLDELGTVHPEANDIWGWTNPDSKDEYAIIGVEEGVAIVNVTDPYRLTRSAFIFSTNKRAFYWHDIKVYQNYIYIVSEEPKHGLQVFDMNRLRNGPIGIVTPDKTIDNFEAHNLVINEDSGYLYVVGSDDRCDGGLMIFNLNNTPESPEFELCYMEDGYTHDAQCVMYNGPDQMYNGREVCFNYNEDSMLIVDVSNKQNIKIISNSTYEGSRYTHQGWATEDFQFLLLNDEYDEIRRGKTDPSGGHTRTYIWDITSLKSPKYMFYYESTELSVDHNLYIKGNLTYQSNYEAGLRILDLSPLYEGENIKEVAYFDTTSYPNSFSFLGTWSAFPYFESGNIALSSINYGLFMLKLDESILPSQSTVPPTVSPTASPTLAPIVQPADNRTSTTDADPIVGTNGIIGIVVGFAFALAGVGTIIKSRRRRMHEENIEKLKYVSAKYEDL